MELNKNISVWRGNLTPPTQYHLWIKENGTMFFKIAGEWTLILSSDMINTGDYISNLKGKDLLLADEDIEVTTHDSYIEVKFKSLDTDDFQIRPRTFRIPEATDTQVGLISKADIGSGIISVKVGDESKSLTPLNGSKDSDIEYTSNTLDFDLSLDKTTLHTRVFVNVDVPIISDNTINNLFEK